MKARGILLAVLIIILCIQLNAEYEEKCFLLYGISNPNRNVTGIIEDANQDGYFGHVINWPNVSVVNEIQRKYKTKYLFEYGDDFGQIKTFGNTDSDSLFEFIGVNGVDDSGYYWIYISEQEEEGIYPVEMTWTSDTIWKGMDWLGVGDIKGDGVTRIYGAGIPEISDEAYRYGWFYMDCTGDNQYEIGGRVSPSTKSGGAMDVGDVNGNGKNDVIFASADSFGIMVFEFNSLSDSFELKLASIPVACEKVLFFPDIDKDGKNEIMRSTTENLLPPSYHFQMFEFDSNYNYDTIWDYTFWGTTDYYMTYGCDISYGDVDSDGDLEFVVCGGSTMRVFDVTGDNTFTEV